LNKVIAKLILLIKEFIEGKNRVKREKIAKQISNLCSNNFKSISTNEPKLVEIIMPLVAMGYYKVNDNKFDPNEKELIRIFNELQQYLMDTTAGKSS